MTETLEAYPSLRQPPQAIDAECAVLGALLLQSNESWDRVGDLLSEDDFYRYEHRIIFRAIGVLTVSNRPADVVTVFEELRHHALEKEAGGLVYLTELAQYVPSAANIRRHAEIIRERAVQRKLITVGDQIASASFEPKGRTVAQLQDEAERLVMAVGDEASRMRAGLQGLDTAVTAVIDRIQELADNGGAIIGTSSGFADLDRRTCGLHAGQLIVLAARPSMGKTSLAMQIAESVAVDQGLPVAVFSMEMGRSQLVTRMLGAMGRIDQTHMRTGQLTDEEWGRFTEAIEKLRQVTLEIDDTPNMSMAYIKSEARRMKRKHGELGLIVVDYLQLMEVSAGGETRATAVGELSRGLKLLGKELGCPVIALSQLSRNVESRTDKRPMMSDLRESGAIEQDADVIMFIYRDEYYNKDSKEPGVAELLIAKQREGPTGTVKLAFVGNYTRFENLASHHDF